MTEHGTIVFHHIPGIPAERVNLIGILLRQHVFGEVMLCEDHGVAYSFARKTGGTRWFYVKRGAEMRALRIDKRIQLVPDNPKLRRPP